jgi:hypothetical protein
MDRSQALAFAGAVVTAGKGLRYPAHDPRRDAGGTLARSCSGPLIGPQPVLSKISALIRAKGGDEVRFGRCRPIIGSESASRKDRSGEQGEAGDG